MQARTAVTPITSNYYKHNSALWIQVKSRPTVDITSTLDAPCEIANWGIMQGKLSPQGTDGNNM